jgi:hypothetical protein
MAKKAPVATKSAPQIALVVSKLMDFMVSPGVGDGS